MSLLKFARKQFPGLDQEMIFMDNAGGSQIAQASINAIVNFYQDCHVQLGADYANSVTATERVNAARNAIAQWLNAAHSDEVIVGASSTLLVRLLSLQLAKTWQAGDEVIITNVDHEANRSCWLDLAQQGIVIKVWQVNPQSHELELSALKALITNKTRLLCCTHVSNIYGSINPIQQWAEIMHQQDAAICVDGVAYAPHRMLDVQKWDVDYYFFSSYKTFGPHQAVLYGKQSQLKKLPGINHHFIDKTTAKFEPGNVNYELICGIHGAINYLQSLGRFLAVECDGQDLRAAMTDAFQAIANHEENLLKPLMCFLKNHPNITVIGEDHADQDLRVATVSFVHDRIDSRRLVKAIDKHKIGIRYGDFYAVALIDALGLRTQHGVVRVSLAHYNTPEEVSQLIELLKQL